MSVRTNKRCAYPGCKARLWSHHVRAGETLCGIHQICEQGFARTELPGAVPAHFNAGLGEWIEDRDHLRKRREYHRDIGNISAWD